MSGKMDGKITGKTGRRLVIISAFAVFAVFFIAACENSTECKDSQGNSRIWSTENCPSFKCRGTDLICCEGPICGDTCYADLSQMQNTEGCVMPGVASPECPANQVWDYSLKACKDISAFEQQNSSCELLQYNKCFIDCLHNENRECDAATCKCGDYYCQQDSDCPKTLCAGPRCVIASDGKSKCVC